MVTIKDLGSFIIIEIITSSRTEILTFDKKTLKIKFDSEGTRVFFDDGIKKADFYSTSIVSPVYASFGDVVDGIITMILTMTGVVSGVGGSPSYELLSNKSSNMFADWNSTDKYPNVKTVKEYIDNSLTGLLDYRGGYDPLTTGGFPAVGGSGNAGAIKAGDTFIILSASILGMTSVIEGDMIIAKIDDATNDINDWDVLSTNVAYVPEDSAKKVTSVNVSSTDEEYPSAKAMYVALLGKVNAANLALSIIGNNLTLVGGNTIALPSNSASHNIISAYNQTNHGVVNANSFHNIAMPSLMGSLYVPVVGDVVEFSYNIEPVNAAGNYAVALGIGAVDVYNLYNNIHGLQHISHVFLYDGLAWRCSTLANGVLLYLTYCFLNFTETFNIGINNNAVTQNEYSLYDLILEIKHKI
jgi:hypothetical protein